MSKTIRASFIENALQIAIEEALRFWVENNGPVITEEDMQDLASMLVVACKRRIII